MKQKDGRYLQLWFKTEDLEMSEEPGLPIAGDTNMDPFNEDKVSSKYDLSCRMWSWLHVLEAFVSPLSDQENSLLVTSEVTVAVWIENKCGKLATGLGPGNIVCLLRSAYCVYTFDRNSVTLCCGWCLSVSSEFPFDTSSVSNVWGSFSIYASTISRPSIYMYVHEDIWDPTSVLRLPRLNTLCVLV